MQFADAFLQTLLVGGVLRYLAVAHFGRGRGNYVESEAPAFWQDEVERAVREFAGDGVALWRFVRSDPDRDDVVEQLEDVVTKVTRATLAHLYPQQHRPDLARQVLILIRAETSFGICPQLRTIVLFPVR